MRRGEREPIVRELCKVEVTTRKCWDRRDEVKELNRIYLYYSKEG